MRTVEQLIEAVMHQNRGVEHVSEEEAQALEEAGAVLLYEDIFGKMYYLEGHWDKRFFFPKEPLHV